MMKQFIFAFTSIVCIISISNIAEAGGNSSKNRSNSITKETNSSRYDKISAQDFKDIEKVIIIRYKKINNSPKYPAIAGHIWFYEVKKMRVSPSTISTAGDRVSVEILEDQRQYTYSTPNKENETSSKNYSYSFSPVQTNVPQLVIGRRLVKLIKENGEWKAIN